MSAARRTGLARRVFIIFLVIAVLAGLGYAAYRFLNKKVNPLDNVSEINTHGDMKAYPFDDGFLTVSGSVLTRWNTSGQEVFSLDLAEEGMKVSSSKKLTVAWSAHRYVVINSSGTLLQQENSGDEILMMRAGGDTFSMTVMQDGQRVTLIYKALDVEEPVERFIMPYQSAVDSGFCGNGYTRFWLVTLDSHNTIPSAQLKVLQPGKALTANITINAQTVYAVHPGEQYFYTIGTHSICRWDGAGSLTAEESVYGWTLFDTREDKSGSVSFLMGAAETDSTTPLSSVRLITFFENGSVTEQEFALPAGSRQAFLGSNTVYAFTEDGLNTLNLKTGISQYFPSEKGILDVVGVGGSAIISWDDGSADWIRFTE